MDDCDKIGLDYYFTTHIQDVSVRLDAIWSVYKTFLSQHFCVKELRGEVWEYSSNLMCFLNGLLLGNEKDLCSWAKTKWDFSFSQPENFYMELSQDYYSKHLQNTQASNF